MYFQHPGQAGPARLLDLQVYLALDMECWKRYFPGRLKSMFTPPWVEDGLELDLANKS